MKCAWDSFLRLLPPHIRNAVDKLGQTSLQELRVRVGQALILVTSEGEIRLNINTNISDIQYIINAASQYSPWSAETMCNGFITAEGGHRVGMCGSTVMHAGFMTGFRTVTSVCLRVARDFPGIACGTKHLNGSVLILGRPGSGKTTLLRDMIRQKSLTRQGSVVVVDERGELFPSISGRSFFDTGPNTDILSGCSKKHGIELAIRTMGASFVAVDEISSEIDCDAIRNAGWCGVPILATAHASDISDLKKRQVYKPLVEQTLFDAILVMQKDKTWKEERLAVCT